MGRCAAVLAVLMLLAPAPMADPPPAAISASDLPEAQVDEGTRGWT